MAATKQRSPLPQPSPPVEEREETAPRRFMVTMHVFRTLRLHEPSNKHAAPTELERGGSVGGGNKHGALTELFNLIDGSNARSLNVEADNRGNSKRHGAAALQNLADGVACEKRASVQDWGSPMPLSLSFFKGP
jgi:hypothetical protein